jgi:hypothetical protein
VPPPLKNTPVLAKLGFDPRTMPMKPMSVEQCVSEGLNALRVNRSRIIPGRLNRIMNALMPASVKRNHGEAAWQSACAQARSCKRTGRGLINGLRMGRIIRRAQPGCLPKGDDVALV